MLKGIIGIVIALVMAGSAFGASAYSDAVEVRGDLILVSRAAHDHAVGEGLVKILNQAASEQIFDADGDALGFRLFDIEAGSVFQTLGIVDGDVVTHIDGTRLATPQIAVDLLRWAKGEDRFEVTLLRDDEVRVLRVRVTQ